MVPVRKSRILAANCALAGICLCDVSDLWPVRCARWWQISRQKSLSLSRFARVLVDGNHRLPRLPAAEILEFAKARMSHAIRERPSARIPAVPFAVRDLGLLGNPSPQTPRAGAPERLSLLHLEHPRVANRRDALTLGLQVVERIVQTTLKGGSPVDT